MQIHEVVPFDPVLYGFVFLVAAWYVLYGCYNVDRYWCEIGIQSEEKMRDANLTGYDPQFAYWECVLTLKDASYWVHGLLNWARMMLYMLGTGLNVGGVGLLALGVLLSPTGQPLVAQLAAMYIAPAH